MQADPIGRYRRFARIVTAEIGALDDSFLGRGRPLGAARVLTAIGAGRSDVASLREALGLDSGLMSRLLRGLEEEGLVELGRHASDGRRRIAMLTPAGRDEYEAYERLSDERARSALARCPDTLVLLEAMDRIASVLGRNRVSMVEVDPRESRARFCLDAYYAELAARFEGGFEVERSRDPQADAMIRPRGAFILAMSDGLAIGCVGLKGGRDFAEIKRMWVAPSARGLGLARRLMDAAENAARSLGITTLRLDSNRTLTEAIDMYRHMGWTEIPRFNDDPYAQIFFEKRL